MIAVPHTGNQEYVELHCSTRPIIPHNVEFMIGFRQVKSTIVLNQAAESTKCYRTEIIR